MKFEIPKELRESFSGVAPRPEGTALHLTDLHIGTKFRVNGTHSDYRGEIISSPFLLDNVWRIEVGSRTTLWRQGWRAVWELSKLGLIPEQFGEKPAWHRYYIEYSNRFLRFISKRTPVDPRLLETLPTGFG